MTLIACVVHRLGSTSRSGVCAWTLERPGIGASWLARHLTHNTSVLVDGQRPCLHHPVTLSKKHRAQAGVDAGRAKRVR